MPSPTAARTTWDIMLPDETATARLAADIALALIPDDLVTLSGDLGAGKTTIARSIIRTLAGDETIEVPSPTFTLLQLYELPRFPVVHADLYRVTTLAELSELGWEEAAEGAAVLVEWPERASAFIQADRLDVSLSLALEFGPNARQVRLTGFGSWAARLTRFRAARELLDSAGFGAAERIPIQGDASTRSYERLLLHPGSAILMNSPPRPDGPPLKDGKQTFRKKWLDVKTEGDNISLDDWIGETSPAGDLLLQIDIEGAEDIVLTAFFATAPRERWPRLIFMERNGPKWKTDILALCLAHGYRELAPGRMNVILELAY